MPAYHKESDMKTSNGNNAIDLIYKTLLDDPQTPIDEIVKAAAKKGHVVTAGYVGAARRNFFGITEFLRTHGALAENPTEPVETPKPKRTSRRKVAEPETKGEEEQPQEQENVSEPTETETIA
jgi:hypothetical protein